MKNFLKPTLVSILTSRPVAAIADSLFHNSVPIFMLHRVSPQPSQNKHVVSADHLRHCFDYLVDHDYTFVSLEDLITALKNKEKLPLKSVVFTMDDGYIDQAEIAAPIILEYNCPITFFVITGMLDQLLWPWDAKVAWIIESMPREMLESSITIKNLNLDFEQHLSRRALRRSVQIAMKKQEITLMTETLQSLANEAELVIPSAPPSEFQSMTWDMARELEDRGVHFAPHSNSHHILSKLDRKSMEREIEGSWNRVKNELRNPRKLYCYPNGEELDFGNREIEYIKSIGFEGAVSTKPSTVQYKVNSDNYIYSLPRLSLPNNMVEFVQYCSWLERARTL